MKPHLVDFTSISAKPWVLAFSLGQRTKNGSADTLKKQWAGLLETWPRTRQGIVKPGFYNEAQGKLLRNGLASKSPGKPLSSEGFIQALPARVISSPTHVQWVGFGLLKSMESNSLHFRQPALEFLARAAGTFQWKDVLAKVTLQNVDKDVVLIWMGPQTEWDEKKFVRVAKEWGLVARNKWPNISAENEVFALERSALVGLE